MNHSFGGFILYTIAVIMLILRKVFGSCMGKSAQNAVRIKPETNKLYAEMVRRKMTTEQMIDKLKTHPRMCAPGMELQRSIPDKATTPRHTSIGEYVSQKCLSDTFGRPFEKIRPDWLKNPKTGRNLELDMWCAQSRIALEYQGSQHYLFPNSFHADKKQFQKQVERDKLKAKLCKTNKVTLLIVPYTVPHERIPAYIYCELIQKWRTPA